MKCASSLIDPRSRLPTLQKYDGVKGDSRLQRYDTDVVVIGAGPAGSIVAAEIARKGPRVTFVEKNASPGQTTVCAGGIDKDSVQHLDLPQRIIEKNIATSIYYFQKRVYSLTSPSLSVQRNVFDRFLAERAETQGAKLLTSTMARNVARKKDGIVVFLRNLATNENYEVNTKLVIFADGSNTLSSRKFENIGFVRKPENTAFAAIYEIQWEENPYDDFEYFFEATISPWGYGWIFPKKNLVNVGVMSLMSKMRTNIKTLLDYLVDDHPIASRKLQERRKLRFAADIIPLQHARKIYTDRVLVVGDAAGMVDPLWGGGISYAIRGSTIAATVVVKALEKNRFDEKFLSLFERMWKKDRYFKHLMRQQLLSKLFLAFSRLDKNAYFKLQMLSIELGKIRRVHEK